MKNKKISKLMLLSIIAVAYFSCSGVKDPHIGEWVNSDPSAEEIHKMILYPDNSAVFEIDGMLMGGDHYSLMEEGVEIKFSITYEINYDKDPVWLDFTMYPVEIRFSEGSEIYPDEQKQMIEEMILTQGKEDASKSQAIIRFNSNNQMEFQGNEGELGELLTPRPTEFEPGSFGYSLFIRE